MTNKELEAAETLICELAKHGDKAWRMSIPPRPDDSDNLLLRVCQELRESQAREVVLRDALVNSQTECSAIKIAFGHQSQEQKRP